MSDLTASLKELDALLARVSDATDRLRALPPEVSSGDVERALVSDLANVATILRADATAIGEALAGILSAAPGPAQESHQP